MALRRSVHIILNPAAGARRRGLLDAVVERLKRGGATVTLELTERAGHATALARRAAERGDADVVVAAGGDGTINEVARGLLGQGVPLGILPLGTANVLAIELGLRPRAVEVADMLLSGPAHLVGTGVVDGEIFLMMVGIGFDGVVVHAINPRLKRLWGKGAFVWAGVKEWLRGPGRDIRLVADGREKRAQWAIVVNGRYFAGPYVLSREGDISQPGLTLFLFKNGGRIALVRYLIALGLGRMAKLRDVEILPARQVRFLEPEGLEVEVDGDARGNLPQTIEQGTRFLRLVVPQNWKP
ncbi:diacylglycerol kinase family protein [Parvibaculum sp.]|uniref:diacylglycerol/lipid kinase family protein n=1 Tax=Parvibaculum sp. TaxID=2024848 RepID=UPI002C77D1E8|nr:diacylglycerol kinase family protein [Parvibaculum sp.]HUD52867.1 diacylglycerol kinase family protein [Parvibaculum sp.]